MCRGNIPGSKVSLGDVLVEYFPPAPPRLTGSFLFHDSVVNALHTLENIKL